MPDSIAKFARSALERAEKRLETATQTRICVAGITVAIDETSPMVVNWLSGQFDPPAATSRAFIYCDYSGTYLPELRALGDLSMISPLQFDEAFARAGLFGSFDANQNRMDLFDPARKIGLRLHPHATAYPEWEPTAPLANLLGWVMRSAGRMVMHTASLSIDGTGVLLSGPGGSGKSGTTLAGVANGLQSVGDDYCVVTPVPSPVARPLYRMMKQDSKGLARVGIKGVKAPLNWQGKHVFDLRDVFPAAATNEAKVKAILLPKVSRLKTTKLETATSFEALHSLAPSTMLQLGGDRSATFKACAQVVRTVPAFHLYLSENPREIAAAIKHFILERSP